MALNATAFPNISRIVAGSVILFPNDSILLCDTSVAPVTMTLLEIPANSWQTTWKLYVLDNSNNALAQNITISAPVGYTINGASSIVINVNGGACVVTITSNTTFLGQLNYSTGGGGTVAASNTAGIVVANCNDFKFDSTYFNVTNPSGSVAGVSIVQLESMFAQQTPISLARVAPSGGATIFNNGTIQLITEIYDDGNDYDPLTGIWTCPATGRYNVNCYAHYSEPVLSWSSGMFTVGIMTPDQGTQICGNWCTVTQTTKHIDITATANGLALTAGYQLCCVVLNQLNTNYVIVNGDVIRFSIQRIK
jgi:hypothetical protein